MQHVTTEQPSGYTRNGGNPHGTGGRPAHLNVLERPRYFPRQLMTPDELTLEADYFRDRLRRHNVYLHGWGVVCGALVCVVPTKDGSETEPWVVQVQPGYVLGPYGDEIVIDGVRTVSLRGNGISGYTEGYDDLTDPWCTEVYVDHQDGPLYVAVRYREFPVRPVRAQPAGCGCDETPCEYSRFRDGYEIRILDACPDSHQLDDGEQGTEQARGNPTCPAVPDSPWVVLAGLTLDDDGTITKIDNCVCRRIVPSARDSSYRCGSTEGDHPPPTEKQQEPAPPPKEQPQPAPVDSAAGTQPPDPDAPKPPGRQRRRRAAGANP